MSQISPGSEAVRDTVRDAVASVKITDIHTHLYSPRFGSLLLLGIDELLTYHYLIAETFRWIRMPYEDFWRLTKREQADLVWQTLFIEHSPCSEACRGVLTVLQAFGLDIASRGIDDYRAFFEQQNVGDHINRVFELAGVESVVMTNDPFNDQERKTWLNDEQRDPRFHSALRLDALLESWQTTCDTLRGWGYDVREDLKGQTAAEVRRFLDEWIERMNPLYLAVSLGPEFAFPDNSPRSRLMEECVLPVAGEREIPLALMIGVKRSVNPELRAAGDGVGIGSVSAIEHLCRNFPKNKFLVTMLSLENQHELCVVARKFRNLMIFGCWWFLNNPSLIDEITRMRIELLGVSVIPQHSDARILEQIIYKWDHSRRVIGDVLADKYADLAATGWRVSEQEIRRDVSALFGGNFRSFLKK